ncbi:AFP-A1 Ninja-family protein 1 [Nymphaea thermarum]|nr:AFP-A1 Ninja-family protein 1 [Nymphaea thermarum]
MDLLQKLMARDGRKADASGPDEEDPAGLELGLSLGGCFSSDKKKLGRAASIANLEMVQSGEPPSFRTNKLSRWSSLPAKNSWLDPSSEIGFLLPERQEIGELSAYGGEAKRQRLAGRFEETLSLDQTREGGSRRGAGPDFTMDFSCRVGMLRSMATTDRQPEMGFSGHFPTPSQGSCSSGLSGSKSLKNLDSQRGVGGGDSIARSESVPAKMKSMMGDLPYVCTRDAGQNGKKIEGFLYKYDKGEEIRIVCACHGNFLSPAEFVKHGGGGDVEHPLRHIVVNAFPPFLR